MTIDVTFDGNTYEIPEDGDVNWENLTDYLVALSNAATSTSIKYNARIVTTTPQTMQTSDAFLYVNVGSAAAVNLPAGVSGQIYGIVDISGIAATNNITVTPNGAETINDAANYVIRSNYGAVVLQFDGTQWRITSEISNVRLVPLKAKNNSTNASFYDASITAYGAFATAADGESCSADFNSSHAIEFVIALDTGEAINCKTSYAENVISAVSDISNIFLTSDSGVGIYVHKSSASAAVTIKNRMGTSADIEIKAITNTLSSVTDWS